MSAASQRDEAVDALKALALVGVGLINIQLIAYPDAGTGLWSREAFPSRIDTFVVAALNSVVAGKFITIFMIVFGWSMHAKISQGQDGVAQSKRRLVALAIMGLLHAIFIFAGDVLFAYAIVGWFVLRSRDWSDERFEKSIRRWLTEMMIIVLALTAGTLFLLRPYLADVPRYDAEFAEIFRNGDFRTILTARLSLHGYVFLVSLIFGVLWAVPIIRMGYLLRRRQEASGIESVEALARAWMRRLLLPAVLINGVCFFALNLAKDDGQIGAFVTIASYPGGIALGLVYAGAAFVYLRRESSAGVRSWLAMAGRNSLSIYILQSIVAGYVMYGYGLGRHAQYGPLALIGLSLAITATLASLSVWWSRRFGQGPFERALRWGASAKPTTPAS